MSSIEARYIPVMLHHIAQNTIALWELMIMRHTFIGRRSARIIQYGQVATVAGLRCLTKVPLVCIYCFPLRDTYFRASITNKKSSIRIKITLLF